MRPRKWGVEGFSEVLAKEVGPLGIKVTIVEPGGFRTDFAGASTSIYEGQPEYDSTVGKTARFQRDFNGKTGDEAAMALSAGQFISFLTSNVYTRLVQERPSPIGFRIRGGKTLKPLWYFWIGVPIVAVLWFVCCVFWGWPALSSPMLYGIALALLLSVLASKTTMLDKFALAGAFIAVVVSGMMTSLAFGVLPSPSTTVGPLHRIVKAMIMSFLVDINIEASPAGEHTFVQFERDTNLDTQGALLHSLYDDSRVRKFVEGWVKHWIPE